MGSFSHSAIYAICFDYEKTILQELMAFVATSNVHFSGLICVKLPIIECPHYSMTSRLTSRWCKTRQQGSPALKWPFYNWCLNSYGLIVFKPSYIAMDGSL